MTTRDFMLFCPIGSWVEISTIPGVLFNPVMDILISGSYARPGRINMKNIYKKFRIVENEDFTAFMIVPGKSRLEEEKCQN